jgi:hypothetical protein
LRSTQITYNLQSPILENDRINNFTALHAPS